MPLEAKDQLLSLFGGVSIGIHSQVPHVHLMVATLSNALGRGLISAARTKAKHGSSKL